MDPLVAELTLAEVRAVQTRNRRRAAAVRLPLALIGGVTLLAAPWAQWFGRDHVAAFYAPCLLATAVYAAVRYRRISLHDGKQVSIAPWAVTAVVLLVGSAATSRIGAASGVRWLDLAGPSVVFAAGYLALARWGRNSALAVASGVMIADSLAAPAFLEGDACVSWQLALNGVLLVTAAALTRPVVPAS